MDAAVLDCLVEDYEYLISSLECPDPNDRHVIAAAIKAGCSAIVTFNLKHFPPDLLVKYHIEPLHPDEFIHRQFARERTTVLSAARRCRLRLKAPQMSQEEYLRRLEIQSLPKTVADLSGYSSMI